MTDSSEEQTGPPPGFVTRFHLLYVRARQDPYFAVRWDQGTMAEIVDVTVEGAARQLRAILGEPDRYDRWCIRVEKITQEPIDSGGDHAPG